MNILSTILDLYSIPFIAVLVWMNLFFVIAQIIKNNSIADIAWGLGFIVVALSVLITNQTDNLRSILVILLVTLWGTRLAIYIGIRNAGKKEDWRYKNWREQWGNKALLYGYLQVFLLQGLIMLIVSLPVIFIIRQSQAPQNSLDLLGAIIWIIGFIFESVGDYQLFKFKGNPKNKGKVMNQGLWRYTRHPNYFGETLMWWGIFLMALNITSGFLTFIGPLTITFLLLKVSGVTLLEKKYHGNPEYINYQKTTNSFIPLPPKKTS